MTSRERVTGLVCLLNLLLLADAGLAAEPAADWRFPANPSQWINSPPLSRELLQGKAACLWFFEEGCPRCRSRWPELLEQASQFQGQPIVFIAINSGTSRGAVERYVIENGVTWPVIVDPLREFERACGQDEIDKNNIFQMKVVRADGRIETGDWSDVPGTVRRALEGAEWNVDPAEIPAPLQPAWLAVEFGSFPAAAPLIRQHLRGRTELRAGAEILQSYIDEQLAADWAAVQQAQKDGKLWRAFVGVQRLSERFDGYQLPPEAVELLKTLGTDPDVKAEKERFRKLDAIRKTMNVGTNQSAAAASRRLKEFLDEAPADSDSAQDARTLPGLLED